MVLPAMLSTKYDYDYGHDAGHAHYADAPENLDEDQFPSFSESFAMDGIEAEIYSPDLRQSAEAPQQSSDYGRFDHMSGTLLPQISGFQSRGLSHIDEGQSLRQAQAVNSKILPIHNADSNSIGHFAGCLCDLCYDYTLSAQPPILGANPVLSSMPSQELPSLSVRQQTGYSAAGYQYQQSAPPEFDNDRHNDKIMSDQPETADQNSQSLSPLNTFTKTPPWNGAGSQQQGVQFPTPAKTNPPGAREGNTKRTKNGRVARGGYTRGSTNVEPGFSTPTKPLSLQTKILEANYQFLPEANKAERQALSIISGSSVEWVESFYNEKHREKHHLETQSKLGLQTVSKEDTQSYDSAYYTGTHSSNGSSNAQIYPRVENRNSAGESPDVQHQRPHSSGNEPFAAAWVSKEVKEKTKTFGCTWPPCEEMFRSMRDLIRHEESVHCPQYKWTCTLNAISGKRNKGKTICEREFKREDKILAHLRDDHRCIAGVLGNMVQELRRPVNPPSRFNPECGFCGEYLSTWKHRMDHISMEYSRNGKKRYMWQSPWPRGSSSSSKYDDDNDGNDNDDESNGGDSYGPGGDWSNGNNAGSKSEPKSRRDGNGSQSWNQGNYHQGQHRSHNNQSAERPAVDGNALCYRNKNKTPKQIDSALQETADTKLMEGSFSNICNDGTRQNLSFSLNSSTGAGEKMAAYSRASSENQEDEAITRSMGRRKPSTAVADQAIKRCHEPGCNQEFKRSCKLKRHEQTHNSSLKCSKVGCRQRGFKSPYDLKMHELGHSHLWKCSHCEASCKFESYIWPTERELHRHIKDEHPFSQIIYLCMKSSCRYKFQLESDRQKHMEEFHGSSVRPKDNWPPRIAKQSPSADVSTEIGPAKHSPPEKFRGHIELKRGPDRWEESFSEHTDMDYSGKEKLDIDSMSNWPTLPRRAQISVEDVVKAHKRRAALTLADFDLRLSGVDGTSSMSITDRSRDVPSAGVPLSTSLLPDFGQYHAISSDGITERFNHHGYEVEIQDNVEESDLTDQHHRQHLASDSGIGSSISSGIDFEGASKTKTKSSLFVSKWIGCQSGAGVVVPPLSTRLCNLDEEFLLEPPHVQTIREPRKDMLHTHDKMDELDGKVEDSIVLGDAGGGTVGSTGHVTSIGSKDENENNAAEVTNNLNVGDHSRATLTASATSIRNPILHFGISVGEIKSAINLCHEIYEELQHSTYRACQEFNTMAYDIRSLQFMLLLQLPSSFGLQYEESNHLYMKHFGSCHLSLKELSRLLKVLEWTKGQHIFNLLPAMDLDIPRSFKSDLHSIDVRLKVHLVKTKLLISMLSVRSGIVTHRNSRSTIASSFSTHLDNQILRSPISANIAAMMGTPPSSTKDGHPAIALQCFFDTDSNINVVSRDLAERLTVSPAPSDPQHATDSLKSLGCSLGKAANEKYLDRHQEDLVQLLEDFPADSKLLGIETCYKLSDTAATDLLNILCFFSEHNHPEMITLCLELLDLPDKDFDHNKCPFFTRSNSGETEALIEGAMRITVTSETDHISYDSSTLEMTDSFLEEDSPEDDPDLPLSLKNIHNYHIGIVEYRSSREDLHQEIFEEWTCCNCFETISSSRPPVYNPTNCQSTTVTASNDYTDLISVSNQNSVCHWAPTTPSSYSDTSVRAPEGPERDDPNRWFIPLAPEIGYGLDAYLRSPSHDQMEQELGNGLRFLLWNPLEPPYRYWDNHEKSSERRQPVYEALSYTWGCDEESFPTSCSARKDTIKTSLSSALRALRSKTRERILWTDSLCINQVDRRERHHQVELMRSAFKNPASIVDRLGLEETRRASRGTDADEWGSCHKNGALEGFEKSWYRRQWVIQEIALAANILGDLQMIDPAYDRVYRSPSKGNGECPSGTVRFLWNLHSDHPGGYMSPLHNSVLRSRRRRRRHTLEKAIHRYHCRGDGPRCALRIKKRRAASSTADGRPRPNYICEGQVKFDKHGPDGDDESVAVDLVSQCRERRL